MKNVKFSKSILILNECYGRIMTNFNNISISMQKFFEFLPDKSQLNMRESFTHIFKSYSESKDYFQKFYSQLSDTLNKESASSSFTEETSNNVTNINSDNSPVNIHKTNMSYEKIFKEFSKIEKVTKELNTIKNNSEEVRKKRVKLLEIKLQNFCEEVKHVNFQNIINKFDEIDLSAEESNNTNRTGIYQGINPNVRKSSNMLLEKSTKLNNPGKTQFNVDDKMLGIGNTEEFNIQDSILPSITVKTIQSDYQFQEKTLPKNLKHNEDKTEFINQILNLNVTKETDMIQFIESLLMKTESVYNENVRISSRINNKDKNVFNICDYTNENDIAVMSINEEIASLINKENKKK